MTGCGKKYANHPTSSQPLPHLFVTSSLYNNLFPPLSHL